MKLRDLQYLPPTTLATAQTRLPVGDDPKQAVAFSEAAKINSAAIGPTSAEGPADLVVGNQLL
jgi:hypothetical protein